jgi:hypothetical protein
LLEKAEGFDRAAIAALSNPSAFSNNKLHGDDKPVNLIDGNRAVCLDVVRFVNYCADDLVNCRDAKAVVNCL